MKELKKTLDNLYEKYKKEYTSICEPVKSIISAGNNAEKFHPLKERLQTEIIKELNDCIKENPKTDTEIAFKLCRKCSESFDNRIYNPFI